MDENKELEFLPFHAINEFMNDEYRLRVIQETLNGLPSLSTDLRKPIEKFTNHMVKIPGFRNPSKAPVNLKIKPFIEAFEKQPQLVAVTLTAWADLHNELKNQVFELLRTRHWELLPIDVDRTKLPGFLIVWPTNETFDTIYQAYKEAFPESNANNDDISLMAVWLSLRLPYPSTNQKNAKTTS